MNAPRQDNDVLLILDISYVTYYICLAAVRRWKKQYYETALEMIELPEPGSMPYDELEEMRAQGKTLLVSTHIIDSVDMLWDRTIIMQNGKIKANVTRAELDASGKTLEELFFEVTEGVEAHEMQRGAERASQNDFNHWKIFDHMYSTIYPQLLPRDCTYTIMHPEAEGDDVIASIIQSDFVRKRYRWVILISSDHDFCQLHRPENHLRQFSMDGEEVTCQYKYKRNNRNVVAPISADMAMMLKIITGDKSDNIPGIKQRLGICTAYKLLSEGDGKKNLQDLLDKDPAVKVAFNRNRKLIAFSEIPVKLQQEIVVDLRKKMGESDA